MKDVLKDLPCGKVTILSPEDEHLLRDFPWWRSKGGTYVRCARPTYDAEGKRAKHPKGYYLMDDDYVHRRIMQPPAGLSVDHINGNPLDNRRSNLRVVTHAQNMLNQRKSRGFGSAFRGVSFCPQTNPGRPWYAHIGSDGRQIAIGYFSTEIDAATAVDAVNRIFRRHHSRLQMIDQPVGIACDIGESSPPS